jgi:Lysozyme like domain/Ricin-type beta-trefoil lectin domain
MVRQAAGAFAAAGLLVLAVWGGHAAATSGPAPAYSRADRGAAAGQASAGHAPPGSGAASAVPPRPGSAGHGYRGLHIRMSPAQLASAAVRCAHWASNAGFANTGYLGGWLTTAVAVALAESGCDPGACYNDTTGQACAPPGPRADSVDRGAWQINSRSWHSVSDYCAFSGGCAARAAYQRISQYGTYFAQWVTYDVDDYARYLPAAQRAVNALTRGTVTSGLIGSCLAHPVDRARGRVRLADCGTGSAAEAWLRNGATWRTRRGLCLAVRNPRRAAEVLLARCDGLAWQDWHAEPGGGLVNAGAHSCLNDPRGSITPGVEINDLPCAARRSEVWFLPLCRARARRGPSRRYRGWRMPPESAAARAAGQPGACAGGELRAGPAVLRPTGVLTRPAAGSRRKRRLARVVGRAPSLLLCAAMTPASACFTASQNGGSPSRLDIIRGFYCFGYSKYPSEVIKSLSRARRSPGVYTTLDPLSYRCQPRL